MENRNLSMLVDFYEMTKDRRIDRVDYRDFYTALFEFDT